MLPRDDLHLEMEDLGDAVKVNRDITFEEIEESESLVMHSGVGSGRRRKAPGKCKSFSAWLSNVNSHKCMMYLIVIAVVLMVALVGDEKVELEKAKDHDDFVESTAGSDATLPVTPEGDPAVLEKKKEETKSAPETEEKVDEKVEEKDWGHWHFWDGDLENRPKGDYCGNARNRDITAMDFPDNAWQTDAVYVNHFLDSASELITRAKEAIYQEYGHGLPLTPEQSVERNKMFHIEMSDSPSGEFSTMGGWTNKASFKGLARRLLHAMMTNDNFTVVLGGHSAAAGHGNHFNQSYAMQFQEMMSPIFDRFGVRLITHNLAMGGLGTIQAALGSSSLYGNEIDVILWDSSMTEKNAADFDLFCRQALLGGNRAPFILGAPGANFNVLKKLHEKTGADVGLLGLGTRGVPVTIDEVQVSTLPWATQYLVCDEQSADLCKDNKHKFRTQCWVDRPDVTPGAQAAAVGGTASWHPGFRSHQLTGRVISFWMLQALEDACDIWQEITIVEGDPLPDKYWHISEHIDGIKEKLAAMEDSFCEGNANIPKRACRVALQGRTEYTPRPDPDNTSIRSIMKPAKDGYVPEALPVLYDGFDVPNPSLQLPEGAFDVHEIVAARRRELALAYDDEGPNAQWDGFENNKESVPTTTFAKNSKRALDESIVPGLGYYLGCDGSCPKAGYCDGTISSKCGREPTNNCLLSGHNDGRGSIEGDGLSGWLVMNLNNVKEGLIMIKVSFWNAPNANPRTNGWTTENNERRILRGKENVSGMQMNDVLMNESTAKEANEHVERDLVEVSQVPADAIFEFAINGKITTWNKEQLMEGNTLAQRTVLLITLLDDEKMSEKGTPEDMEVAIRLRGCGRACPLALSHIYWG